MAKINDTTFRDWSKGDIMEPDAYEKEREIIRTAINDNYDRIAKNYVVKDSLGNTLFTRDTDTAIDSLTFKEGTGISVHLNPDTLTLTIESKQSGDYAVAPNMRTWTATAGQTLFEITNGRYKVDMNCIDVYVGGVKQVSGTHYTETSDTSFTLSEGVAADTLVEAVFLEAPLAYTEAHSKTHEQGGYDEIDVTKLKNYNGEIAEPLAEKVYYCDSVAAMKVSSKFKKGDLVKTLGYYNANDGGHGQYLITDSTKTDDGGSVITLDSGLKAELIVYNSVNPLQFGAKGDKTTDDTTFVQKSLDYALANKIKLELTKIHNLFTSVFIDNHLDNYFTFTIEGNGLGGFYTENEINLFSSNLLDYKSHLIVFEGVVFDSLPSSDATLPKSTYVVHAKKFIRLYFNNCNFIRIKCAYGDATTYLQSYYFNDCNIRQWVGTFLTTLNWAFDVHFNMCIAEHNYGTDTDGGFVKMKSPQGCSITNNVIEGLKGRAIEIYHTKSISITGNYFEQNKWDIYAGSSATNFNIHLSGNTMSDAPIVWSGKEIGCTSMSNWGISTTEMHSMQGSNGLVIMDGYDKGKGGKLSSDYVSDEVFGLSNNAITREQFTADIAYGAYKSFVGFIPETLSTYLVTIQWHQVGGVVQKSSTWLFTKNVDTSIVKIAGDTETEVVLSTGGHIAVKSLDSASTITVTASCLRLI